MAASKQQLDEALSQIGALQKQMELLRQNRASSSSTSSTGNMVNTSYASSIPLPKPIDISCGDVVENFRFFQLQWNNYVVSSGLDGQTHKVQI